MTELAEDVEGWLSAGEARLLYSLARECSGKGGIVEIGSWKGKSTIILANGSRQGARGRVYAVDPHTGSEEHVLIYGKVDTYGEFLANLRKAGVEDMVVPIRKTSVEAAADFRLPVELIFIDGAHDFASVKNDFEAWFPLLADGGKVVFHDTYWEGPGRFVKSITWSSSRVKNLKFQDSIVCMEKTARNTISERLENILRLRISRARSAVSGFLGYFRSGRGK